MEHADHEMYRAAIHGDLEAFELVIRKMSRPLFAIAFGALQNRDEALARAGAKLQRAPAIVKCTREAGKSMCVSRGSTEFANRREERAGRHFHPSLFPGKSASGSF